MDPPEANWRTHAVFVNEEGNRVYAAFIGNSADKSGPINGFAILDSRDIKARKPNAQFRLINTMFWDDTSQSQMALPFRSKGQNYMLFTNYAGQLAGSGFNARCKPGMTGWGYARFINIADDRNPQVVSKLMLDVNDPANCATSVTDPVFVGYGSSWCGFDRPTDPRLLACGYLESGLRVFDVRDIGQAAGGCVLQAARHAVGNPPGAKF